MGDLSAERTSLANQNRLAVTRHRPWREIRKRLTGMEAFRGNHPAKVEDGGRLKLPGPFKKIVDFGVMGDML